ncbi:MAG: hypothetical protein JXR00_00760 [Sulfitobacter geojensis]
MSCGPTSTWAHGFLALAALLSRRGWC